MVISAEILHPSHPHLLNWTTRIEAPYKCYGCKVLGFHPRYQCNESACDFHLHEQCSTVLLDRKKGIIQHEFFPNTDFKVFDRSGLPQVGLCVACGNGVQGFRYHSKCTKHVIHPCCFDLPFILKSDDQVPVSLRLCNRIKKRWFKECLRCHKRKISKDIKGWVYVSDSRDICYHVKCIQDWVLDKWKKDQLEYNPNGVLERQISQMAIEHNLPQRKVSKIGWAVVKVALHLVINAVLGEAVSGIINLIS